ncbi:hypothetical protein SZ28_27685 [Burkholderia pseudomallei]|nr:hypothetical protein SZ28_27685 [Burkholderia pseudomallei]
MAEAAAGPVAERPCTRDRARERGAALACVHACVPHVPHSPQARARTLEQDQRAGTGASMSCAFAVRCAAL